MHPRFSVLMTSYNYEDYVGEAIESVIAQTEPSWELIVVDDQSSDGSWSVLQQYAGHDKIRILANERNLGGAASYNRAFEESTGDLIATLNSDDKYRPEYLAVQRDAFAADPGLGLNCTYVMGIDEHGEALAQDNRAAWFNVPRDLNDPATWSWANPMCHSAAILTRQVHEAVGLLDPQLHQTPDWSYWIRCLVAGFTFGQTQRILVESRSTGRGVTHKYPVLLSKEHARTTAQYLTPFLLQRGERDLAVRTTARFFTRPEFLAGSALDVAEIVDSLSQADPSVLAEAIHLSTHMQDQEIGRLRASLADRAEQLAGVRQALAQSQSQLQSSEQQRSETEQRLRSVQQRLERIEASPAYRAYLRARRLTTRKPGQAP